MYRLDSDIMGLLIAIATFLLPAISAILERRKKQKRKKLQEGQVEDAHQMPHDEVDQLAKDIDEIFDQLLGRAGQQQDNQADREELQVEETEEHQEVVEDKVEEILDTVPEEEAEPVAVKSAAPEETRNGEADGKAGNTVVGRLKGNPKDMVLFAEIMNPKFKEL